MKRSIVVGLDLGTSRIKAAVGEVLPDGTISVLALSSREAQGMKRGLVVDMEAASRVVDEVLEEVERISGIQVRGVRIGFGGTSTASCVNRGAVAVGNPNHEITGEDVERAVQAARMIPVPPDRSVVHAIPRQFTVDGHEGIVDPTGMMGSRLEVEVTIVTAMTASLSNLVRTVARTGTKVREIVINSILSAESVLQQAEKQMGVAVVDIGAGTCDVAVYEDEALLFASVLPIGGDYITRDLAVGLRTTMQEAERLKQQEGCASLRLADDVEVEISSIYGKEIKKVSQKTIAAIIQPRVEELLDLIDNELTRVNLKDLPAGIVLTGGTSLLKGIAKIGEEYLNIPVRVGFPENIGVLPDGWFSPEYSTVLGSLLYELRYAHEGYGREHLGEGLLSRILYWFKDLFR